MTRTALVTGAARRIGRALALALAKHGWDIVVHYYCSEPEALATANEIRGYGRQAVAIKANLQTEQDLVKLLDSSIAVLGPLTCLINNAAIFEHDRIETLSLSSWQKHLDINLTAPCILSHLFSVRLPSDSDGCIVNILDQRVANIGPDYFSYTASKAALWTVTRLLAMGLQPKIRVNAIAPGLTLPSGGQSMDEFKEQFSSTPLNRGPNISDICGALMFILHSPATTGQLIIVDGGKHLA